MGPPKKEIFFASLSSSSPLLSLWPDEWLYAIGLHAAAHSLDDHAGMVQASASEGAHQAAGGAGRQDASVTVLDAISPPNYDRPHVDSFV